MNKLFRFLYSAFSIQHSAFLSFIVLCSLFIVHSVSAQKYYPFSDSNTIWSEYRQPAEQGVSCLGLPYYYRNILKNKDTIVNAKKYNQLFYSLVDTNYNTDISLSYNGGLRESNKKVFYIAKDSIHEYLLYDFSVKVGDTIKYNYSNFEVFYCWGIIDSLVVSKIDSIKIVDGTYRRRFWFNSLDGTPIVSCHWIEGIGNDKGLLLPVGLETTGGSGNFLICVMQNENLVYFNSYNEVFNSCFPGTGIKEIIKKNSSFSIIPNPVSEMSLIKWDNTNQFTKIEISDMVGRTLQRIGVVNVTSITINKYQFNEGVYFIKLLDKNGNYFSDKFIVL